MSFEPSGTQPDLLVQEHQSSSEEGPAQVEDIGHFIISQNVFSWKF